MKNVVVDSISRYTDGDVYKHHIFGVFVVNDFKRKRYLLMYSLCICLLFQSPSIDAPAQTLTTAKKSKSV